MPEQQGYDDAADPREDQVGLAEMAAGESLGPLHQSNRVGGDHAGQHAHREDVDQQRVRPLGSEPRQGRVRVGCADHRDDDGREQDDKAPEDHRVHQSRAEALQQLALADHHDRLGARSRGQLVEPPSGLALAHDAVEAPRLAPEQPEGDDQREHQRQLGGVHRCLRISAEIAGTTSFKSPTTE